MLSRPSIVRSKSDLGGEIPLKGDNVIPAILYGFKHRLKFWHGHFPPSCSVEALHKESAPKACSTASPPHKEPSGPLRLLLSGTS